jgi:hypothetical protein
MVHDATFAVLYLLYSISIHADIPARDAVEWLPGQLGDAILELAARLCFIITKYVPLCRQSLSRTWPSGYIVS